MAAVQLTPEEAVLARELAPSEWSAVEAWYMADPVDEDQRLPNR